MRVFLSCLQARAPHPLAPHGFWPLYFKRGAEEAGFEWVEHPSLDWAAGMLPRSEADQASWREQAWQQTLDYLKQEIRQRRVDLFLSYLFPRQIEPSAVRAIQDLGIPVVNFYCDNVRDFVAVPEMFHPFDLHWVPEYKALPMYRKAGLSFLHLPMPCWIPPAHRNPPAKETYGPTFIGSRDVLREVLFAEVLRMGSKVELRGGGWAKDDRPPLFQPAPRALLARIGDHARYLRTHGMAPWVRHVTGRFRRPVDDPLLARAVRPRPDAEQYICITKESTVTIGVNRYPNTRYPFSKPDTYSRLRDIEAPMLGACYLTEWAEGLDQMYDLGAEIETYRTPEELHEKLTVLQKDHARRKQMRSLGQRRALQDHTIQRSLEQIRRYLQRGA